VEGPVRVLLEGRPGVGKTTVARKLVDRLHAESIEAAGFTTRELRERGRRVGFAIESLRGERATLASVHIGGAVRVGRYGVDLHALERIALPSLASPPRGTVVIIDELGKMELASRRLTARVEALFEESIDIVATVHAFRHPVTDRLKSDPEVEVHAVTRTSRAGLPQLVLARLGARRATGSPG
jgi:nucleoside-triphosphatase